MPIILSIRDTTSSWGLITSVSTTSIVDLLEKTGRKKKHFCVCVSFAGRPEPCHAMSLQNPRLRHYRSNRQTRYTLMTVLFSFLKLVFSQFYYTYIYSIYIRWSIREQTHGYIFFISLYYLFRSLSSFSLSLSLLFFSQISFYNHAQDVVQSYFFGVKSRWEWNYSY